ncbi:MAG: hypothetical protein GYB67_07215 [Chloroflexi bacterium]|nr:hypothetical protein [Chloroflexota bacterium]
MNETHEFAGDFDPPERYEIRLKGHVSEHWKIWFEDVIDMHIEGSETRLICRVVDQAALHGLLRKVRDLGLDLISVNRVNPD